MPTLTRSPPAGTTRCSTSGCSSRRTASSGPGRGSRRRRPSAGAPLRPVLLPLPGTCARGPAESALHDDVRVRQRLPRACPAASPNRSRPTVCARWRPESGTCRVVCFTPRHDLALARDDGDGVRAVVDAWAGEVRTLQAHEAFGYVQLFENKGALMGCSNPHPHCQVWATGHVPSLPAPQARDAAGVLRRARARPARRLPGAGAAQRRAHRLRERALGRPGALLGRLAVRDPAAPAPAGRRPAFAGRGGARRAGRRAARDHRRYDNLFRCSFPYSMGWHGRPAQGAHPYWRLHASFLPPLLRSASVRKFLVGYEWRRSPSAT